MGLADDRFAREAPISTNEEIAVSDIQNSDVSFPYQLLGRLQQDCEYYLGFGNRAKKHLWAGDEAEQIAKMKELYAGLKDKPTWISLEDIERYEAAMIGGDASTASQAVDDDRSAGNPALRQRG